MDAGGAGRLNRSSPSCLNRPAQRTAFFHGLLAGHRERQPSRNGPGIAGDRMVADSRCPRSRTVRPKRLGMSHCRDRRPRRHDLPPGWRATGGTTGGTPATVRPKASACEPARSRGRSTVENAVSRAAAGLAVGHAGRAAASTFLARQQPHDRLRQSWPLAQAARERHRFRAAASGPPPSHGGRAVRRPAQQPSAAAADPRCFRRAVRHRQALQRWRPFGAPAGTRPRRHHPGRPVPAASCSGRRTSERRGRTRSRGDLVTIVGVPPSGVDCAGLRLVAERSLQRLESEPIGTRSAEPRACRPTEDTAPGKLMSVIAKANRRPAK